MNINYEGLVCYLHGKKSSKQNNTWIDSSGNNNNATLTNFSDNDFCEDYVQFNGSNYADIPRCVQDDFTLSAEVVLEASTSTIGPWQLWYNYASLIDAETAGVQNDFGLTVSKDGEIYFGIGNPDKTISYCNTSLFNEKHIITCTRNKSTGEYAMYIDGNLINKEKHSNKNSLTYPKYIHIGKGANNKFLSMKLYSIRIYNRVLNDFEIKQDMFFLKETEYANDKNLPTIANKLMDASNIKIANNRYGNRVQTVIDGIVNKADNITKAINQEVINTDYSFKIGKGNNIDVSSDAQDGFGTIGLRGISYQNIFNDTTCVLNGTYNANTNEFTNTSDTWFRIAKTELLKPNTTYTLLFLYKSTVDKIRVRFDNDTEVNNGTTIIRDYGDISTTDNFQQFKQTFTTSSKVGIARLLIRECYNGTVTIKHPMLLEGNYTNNSNLPSYFEGIVGVGDKSKNLFNYKSEALYDSNHVKIEYINDGIRHIATTEVGNWPQGTVRIRLQLKPNTLYTFHREVITSPNYNPNCGNIDFREGSHTFGTYSPSVKTPFVFRTLDSGIVDFDFQAFTFADNIPTVVVEFKHIYLCEGEYDEIKYEPYYGGAKIEILSQNKNLFNWEDVYSQYGNEINSFVPFNGSVKKNGDTISLKLRDNYTWYEQGVSFTPIYCKVGDKFTFSGECKGDITNVTIFKYLEFEKVITDFTKDFSTESWKTFSVSYVATTEGWYVARVWLRDGDFKNVQLTVNENSENYIPPLINKTQTLLDEPLMKLPNGVCDEITKDGKLIRRVGKVVFDGSEDWSATGGGGHSTRNSFEITLSNNYNNTSINISGISNNFSHTLESGIPSADWSFRIRRTGTNGGTDYLLFTPSTNIVPYRNIQSWKQWLSQNPTTVYYELAKPVITDIIPPSVRIYKDGYLTFNTLVAPESTHLVQLNKSAQINNTLEKIQLLNKRVEALDVIYHNIISSTSDILSNLNK